MKKVYNYECYFSNPETGEQGWDLKFISVYAASVDEARVILKTVPNFDEVILFNRAFPPDALDEMQIAEGLVYWETDGYYNVLVAED